jgi:hypothetical protein
MARPRTLTPTLRAWLSGVVHGDPWIYRRLRVPVPIGPLVSPLRYDILIRQRYFEHFAAHRDEYERDFEAYARETRRHAYFVYFRDVTCPRWFPHVLNDDAALEATWRRRLQASAELYESFSRRGFDVRHPITLHAGRRLTATHTGKRVSHRLFAGDGNHRLALLLASGRTELEPDQFRVKHYLRLAPSDTTPYCLSLLRVTPAEYAGFLRRGYPGVPIATDGDRPVVQDGDAPLADEVRRVIDADMPSILEESR